MESRPQDESRRRTFDDQPPAHMHSRTDTEVEVTYASDEDKPSRATRRQTTSTHSRVTVSRESEGEASNDDVSPTRTRLTLSDLTKAIAKPFVAIGKGISKAAKATYGFMKAHPFWFAMIAVAVAVGGAVAIAVLFKPLIIAVIASVAVTLPIVGIVTLGFLAKLSLPVAALVIGATAGVATYAIGAVAKNIWNFVASTYDLTKKVGNTVVSHVTGEKSEHQQTMKQFQRLGRRDDLLAKPTHNRTDADVAEYEKIGRKLDEGYGVISSKRAKIAAAAEVADADADADARYSMSSGR